jgi:NitT/TauT family transport system substrate-binding protein
MDTRRFTIFTLIGAASLLLVACDSGGAGSQSANSSTPAGSSSTSPAPLHKIHMVMGYIPNVQFAAYYMAVDKGYYRAAGLDVNFDYAQVNDALALTAQGKYDFAIASGDEVLVARDKGVPVVYVMAQYQRYPIAVFSKAELKITKPADLVGKKVGLPGKYGSTYIALKAMLYANHIAEQDVNIMEIGYTQAQSVATGQVDAAVGYAMNEPIALQQQGVELHVIQASDQYNLASVGIVTAQKMVDNDPTTIRAFVSASLRGLADVNKDPDAAFAVVGKYIKEATDPTNAALLKASLQETIKFQIPAAGIQLGQADPNVWTATKKFLADSGSISPSTDVSKAYTNEFVQQQ